MTKLIAVLALAISFVACGPEEQESSAAETASQSQALCIEGYVCSTTRIEYPMASSCRANCKAPGACVARSHPGACY